MLVMAVAIYVSGGDPWFVGGLAVMAFVGFFAFIWRVFSYAERHPHHAISEGADVYKILQLEQAAKNPNIIEAQAEPVANTAPPKAITNQGGNGA